MQSQFGVLDFRTQGERLFVNIHHGRNAGKSLLVASSRHGNIEGLFASNLQQLLQLELVIGEIALGFHQIIFFHGTLGRELGKVGFRHLADVDHFLSALLVLLAGFQTFTIDADSFVHIKNLNIELGNLFLNRVGALFYLQLSLFLAQLIGLYLVVVLIAIPESP